MAQFLLVLAALAYTVQAVPVIQTSVTHSKNSVAKAVASIRDDSHILPASLVNEIKAYEADIDKSLLLPLESIRFFVDTDFDALQDPTECFDDMTVQILPENLDVYSYPKSSMP